MPFSIITRTFSIATVLTVVVSIPAVGESWTEFRGDAGRGHASGSAPLTWSESENVVWKTPITGLGWSSPIIANGQVWLTTAVATAASEEETQRRLEGNTGSQPLSVVNHLVMRAVCLDQQTGKVLHDVELMRKESPEPIHKLNSYASPTPVLDGNRLYCHFGPNGTCCLDTQSGEIVWENQSDELVVKTENGAGSTPILWQHLLIVHFDGSDRQFIAAFDKGTGDVVWATQRTGKMNDNPQLKKSYGTPLIVQIDGNDTVMSPAANWLYAYDPANGTELWKLSYEDLGFSIVPKPLERDGVLFMCTSFMKSQLLAIRFAEDGKSVAPHVEWRFKKQVPSTSTPLLVDDLIYFVPDSGGILTCVDANNGELVYRERLGGNYSASPIYADGRLYFFDRDGATKVIKPGRVFELLGTNHLDGSFMASAAVVDNAMFVRTEKAMYRIE